MALQPNFNRGSVVRSAPAVDEGLRQYMLGIYTYMSLGVLLTGLVAYFVGTNNYLLYSIFSSKALTWVVLLAPVGVALAIGFRLEKMKASTAQLLFWVYAALMGLSLSAIFAVYTQASIAKVFFVTAAMFGGMSLYGYTTKKNLAGLGSFLIMGVWGLLVALVVNIFLRSSGLDFLISIGGVLIFTGLTAYDTQIAKAAYSEADGLEMTKKKSIISALNLYLDFINIFIYMLRFLGNSRN